MNNRITIAGAIGLVAIVVLGTLGVLGNAMFSGTPATPTRVARAAATFTPTLTPTETPTDTPTPTATPLGGDLGTPTAPSYLTIRYAPAPRWWCTLNTMVDRTGLGEYEPLTWTQVLSQSARFQTINWPLPVTEPVTVTLGLTGTVTTNVGYWRNGKVNWWSVVFTNGKSVQEPACGGKAWDLGNGSYILMYCGNPAVWIPPNAPTVTPTVTGTPPSLTPTVGTTPGGPGNTATPTGTTPQGGATSTPTVPSGNPTNTPIPALTSTPPPGVPTNTPVNPPTATIPPPTQVPPTSVPPTSVPPTSVPPTARPPTAVPTPCCVEPLKTVVPTPNNTVAPQPTPVAVPTNAPPTATGAPPNTPTQPTPTPIRGGMLKSGVMQASATSQGNNQFEFPWGSLAFLGLVWPMVGELSKKPRCFKIDVPVPGYGVLEVKVKLGK